MILQLSVQKKKAYKFLNHYKLIFKLLGYCLIMVSSNVLANHIDDKHLPKDFVYLKNEVPSITEDVKYATDDNFIGRPIPSYEGHHIILTKQAAVALAKVERAANNQGYSLLVFDGYRPQTAVDYFYQWSQDEKDQLKKAEFYPNIEKSELFKLNYIALRSGHTRGSTVDLTLIDLTDHMPVDMGTPFDYLDPLSHPDNSEVSKRQYLNREILHKLMHDHGFVGIPTEWWHYTLRTEPFPDTYFNFIVK